MSEELGEMAIQHGLIDSPTAYVHREKIEKALRSISDEGKSDAGVGFGGFDFWIKLNGIEYYINAKPKIPNDIATQNKLASVSELDIATRDSVTKEEI